jgi:HK97 family phage prohead protease
MKKELRSLKNVEIRKNEDLEDSTTITGYASVFNEETNIGGYYREVIRPGAFKRAIEEKHDVRALVNHDENLVIGRSKAGTLVMAEDKTGLRVEIVIPNTTIGKDLRVSMERGDVDQMSFAFVVRKESWQNPEDRVELPLREIEDVDLFDVSVVTYPAYEGTVANVRSAKDCYNDYIAQENKVQKNSRKRKLDISSISL